MDARRAVKDAQISKVAQESQISDFRSERDAAIQRAGVLQVANDALREELLQHQRTASELTLRLAQAEGRSRSLRAEVEGARSLVLSHEAARATATAAATATQQLLLADKAAAFAREGAMTLREHSLERRERSVGAIESHAALVSAQANAALLDAESSKSAARQLEAQAAASRAEADAAVQGAALTVMTARQELLDWQQNSRGRLMLLHNDAARQQAQALLTSAQAGIAKAQADALRDAAQMDRNIAWHLRELADEQFAAVERRVLGLTQQVQLAWDANHDLLQATAGLSQATAEAYQMALSQQTPHRLRSYAAMARFLMQVVQVVWARRENPEDEHLLSAVLPPAEVLQATIPPVEEDTEVINLRVVGGRLVETTAAGQLVALPGARAPSEQGFRLDH